MIAQERPHENATVLGSPGPEGEPLRKPPAPTATWDQGHRLWPGADYRQLATPIYVAMIAADEKQKGMRHRASHHTSGRAKGVLSRSCRVRRGTQVNVPEWSWPRMRRTRDSAIKPPTGCVSDEAQRPYAEVNFEYPVKHGMM